MQSVMEFEQEKVDMQKNLDERQLNRSRCIAAPSFQKWKIYIYIYIYIYIHYIYIQKKKKKEEKSIWRQVLPVELKVLPVELNKKQAVAKSYR